MGDSPWGHEESVTTEGLTLLLTAATVTRSFPGGSDGKESACNIGDLGPIPGSGRSPEEGNGYPLQYSSLESQTRWGD